MKQVPKMIESRRLNTKNINDFVDVLPASNMYDQLNTDRECEHFAFNHFKFFE